MCGLIERLKLIKLERAREIWSEDCRFLRQTNSIPSLVQPTLIVHAVSHVGMCVCVCGLSKSLKLLCFVDPPLPQHSVQAAGFTACI